MALFQGRGVDVAGRSVYLAMDKDQQLWLKTQNLLLNFPLAKPS